MRAVTRRVIEHLADYLGNDVVVRHGRPIASSRHDASVGVMVSPSKYEFRCYGEEMTKTSPSTCDVVVDLASEHLDMIDEISDEVLSLQTLNGRGDDGETIIDVLYSDSDMGLDADEVYHITYKFTMRWTEAN